MFKNKILMITGGTGSFGKAVLSRFLRSDVREIRIFSRDEKKQDDMRKRYNSPKLKFYIGDVRDFHSVVNVVRGVDYIFHAAALKQVPSCEFHPLEAVKTNVLGTENVLEAAVQSGVRRVVVLSTDKAVYPINAMGISKAMMEKIAVAKAWSIWEGSTISLLRRPAQVAHFGNETFATAFARIESHYFVHGGFFENDGWLISNLDSIRHIPCILIQGRYDACTPMTTAWDIHKKWPEASLKIVDDAGHAFNEPGIAHEIVCATDLFSDT